MAFAVDRLRRTGLPSQGYTRQRGTAYSILLILQLLLISRTLIKKGMFLTIILHIQSQVCLELSSLESLIVDANICDS